MRADIYKSSELEGDVAHQNSLSNQHENEHTHCRRKSHNAQVRKRGTTKMGQWPGIKDYKHVIKILDRSTQLYQG